MTPAQRSECMRRIRSGNTKPELILRQALHRAGFRFRLHRKDLPGKPDLVFPKYRTVLFVHGCFWHVHTNCQDGHQPKSNTGYWGPKLERNMQRDAEAAERLRAMGWRVLVVWDCETKDTVQLVERLTAALLATP